MYGLVPEYLVVLMALAGYQHYVALGGQANGFGYRRPAVLYDLVIREFPGYPFFDVGEDLRGVLAARVVAGDYGEVAQGAAHPPRRGALGAAPAPAAAEHGYDAAVRHQLQVRKDALQRGVGMGVIHENGEVLSQVHPLQASGHIGEGFYAGYRGARADAPPRGGGDGRQGVIDIVAAEQVYLNRQRGPAGLKRKAGHGFEDLDVLGPEVGRFVYAVCDDAHFSLQ